MKAGYAYGFTGKGSWRSASDESWEIQMVSKTRGATFAGFRTIDGVRCTVWGVPRKGVAPQYYAQTEAAAPPPRGMR